MAVISHISTGGDNNIRHQNSDVLARQRTPERPDGVSPKVVVNNTDAPAEIAPDNYMLLVSRLGAQVGSTRKDAELLANLQKIITLRLTTMPPGARKAVLDIPEAQAMGTANPMEVPHLIVSRLKANDGEAEVMGLLRSPAFAAIMREESRTATYSLYGRLGSLG